MYLGDEGGAGKSMVVKSMIYLTNAWARPYAVRTIASFRKPAVLIRGETAHSFLELSYKKLETFTMKE